RSFPVSTPPAPSIPRGGQTALPLLVEATPAGTGGWDATDEQRTVLALARSAARAHLATAGDGPPRRGENNQTHRRDRGGSEADPQPTTSLSSGACGDCGPDEPGLRHTPPHN
ncbi:hypothetical protein PUR49_37985, partial [Streptomyces sp. BE147]|uniref:hypothetical protein n=1 Tax=Streptomyces sp. BE147 TaxID=3002524 RepID=UPI002E79F124